MRFEKLTSLVSRVFFAVAFVLLALAVIERLVNAIGYTLLGGGTFRSGRLLEFAVVCLVFVVALQLREVREALRQRRP
jgi:hypothetical protein